MDHRDSKKHSDHPSMEKPGPGSDSPMRPQDSHQTSGKPTAAGSKPNGAGQGDQTKGPYQPSNPGPRNPDAKTGSEKSPSAANRPQAPKQSDADGDEHRGAGSDKKSGSGDRNPFASGKKPAETTPHGGPSAGPRDSKKH